MDEFVYQVPAGFINSIEGADSGKPEFWELDGSPGNVHCGGKPSIQWHR